jgi:hypothetical protein
MKPAFEIDPELRGLLEELVADPRSSLRLVPKKPLRYWIDSNEAVRPREISATKLERHLIEAHREELALLLQTASLISYWKAPVLALRPIDDQGEPYDPSTTENTWRSRARVSAPDAEGTAKEVLAQCLEGIRPNQGVALAQASLALSPNNKTRWYLALAVPWSKPQVAIRILARLRSEYCSNVPLHKTLDSLAARSCVIGCLAEAREIYRESSYASNLAFGACYAFNLSCFMDDAAGAKSDVQLLQRTELTGAELNEIKRVLHDWAVEQNSADLDIARRVALQFAEIGPRIAQLSDTYQA